MITHCPFCLNLLEKYRCNEYACIRCAPGPGYYTKFIIRYKTEDQDWYRIIININNIGYMLESNHRTIITCLSCPTDNFDMKPIIKLNRFIPFSSLEESTNIINRILRNKALL